ncbi:MAG TPA: hypothetical protein VGO58_08100 [Chitinophagaceae bacterium]|jgi:hypothetical protein|nr:hypothetical protein [Chitinophagaceae bacterium]
MKYKTFCVLALICSVSLISSVKRTDAHCYTITTGETCVKLTPAVSLNETEASISPVTRLLL